MSPFLAIVFVAINEVHSRSFKFIPGRGCGTTTEITTVDSALDISEDLTCVLVKDPKTLVAKTKPSKQSWRDN